MSHTCNTIQINKTNKQIQYSERQACTQTRTDVFIATRQICNGMMFHAPLYLLHLGQYVFLAVCLPTCSSAFSQICQGTLLDKTSLVSVL